MYIVHSDFFFFPDPIQLSNLTASDSSIKCKLLQVICNILDLLVLLNARWLEQWERQKAQVERYDHWLRKAFCHDANYIKDLNKSTHFTKVNQDGELAQDCSLPCKTKQCTRLYCIKLKASGRSIGGAMGAIAPPYGVEIIFFHSGVFAQIVVFLQKLNNYPLYLDKKQ